MAATTTLERPTHESTVSTLRWGDFPLRGSRFAQWMSALVAFVIIGSAIGWLIVHPFDSSIGGVDRSISDWMGAGRTSLWNSLTWWGSTLADSWVKIPAAVLLVGFFLLRWKRWFEAVLLGGGLVLESTAFVVTSFIVGRDRPVIEQLDSIPPTGSFPSGHTAAAVVFYGALALIVWSNTSNRLARAVASVAAGVVPLVVGASRVYRGMHFTSDVVFGALLGLASLVVMWSIMTRRPAGGSLQREPARRAGRIR